MNKKGFSVKIVYSLLVLLLCSTKGDCQEMTSPDFVAKYTFRCIKDTINTEYFKENSFVLIREKKESRFHHEYAQFNDSIISVWEQSNPVNNSNRVQDANPFMDYFRKYKKSYAMDFWAAKDLKIGVANVSVLWHIPSYHIEVTYPLPWELSSDAPIVINGVICRTALVNYGGRKWKAYYSTDIAVPDGPYVFAGLPGLIVRVEDEQEWYRFDLTNYKVKPGKEYFWRAKHYYNYGSQRLDRSAYVKRVTRQQQNPDVGPVPTTEAQLLEMKQRFSRYLWRLMELQ